jgi:lipoprotein NlpD
MLVSYLKVSFLFTLIGLITGCAGFDYYDPNKPRNYGLSTNKVVTHHRVEAGETLYSIAFAYGRDHRDVARWNRIPEPYTIYPKQRLRVIPIISDQQQIKRTKASAGKRVVRKQNPVKEKTVYVSNSKLKWSWPTQGKVVSTFSIRDPGRRGIDIVGRKGQPVKAAAAGKVVYRGNGLRGYGNLIIIKHNETYFSAYAHTEDVVVKENEKVKLGQQIADMGNTSSANTKLHFEIRRNGKPVNPMSYLPKRR